MTSPQDQFADRGHRTQENFKRLWQQWSDRSNELIKRSAAGQPRPAPLGAAPRRCSTPCLTSPSS